MTLPAKIVQSLSVIRMLQCKKNFWQYWWQIVPQWLAHSSAITRFYYSS